MNNHYFNIVLGSLLSLNKLLQIKDFENEIKKTYEKIEVINKSLYNLRSKKIPFYNLLDKILTKKLIRSLEKDFIKEMNVLRSFEDIEAAFITAKSIKESAILNGLIK